MSVVMFAIIGAMLEAGAAYWICYTLYCVTWLIKLLIKVVSD